MRLFPSWRIVAALLAAASPLAAQAQATMDPKLAAISSAPVPELSPTDAAELGTARELVTAIMPPEQRNGMVRQVMEALAGQLRAAANRPGTDPGIRQIVDRRIPTIPQLLSPVVAQHLPAIAEAMAQAYAREFTMAELQEIKSFATSPTGKRYFTRAPLLVADPAVARANEAYLRDVNAVGNRFTTEISQEVQRYLAAKGKK